jgi:hypothetical protein
MSWLIRDKPRCGKPSVEVNIRTKEQGRHLIIGIMPSRGTDSALNTMRCRLEFGRMMCVLYLSLGLFMSYSSLFGFWDSKRKEHDSVTILLRVSLDAGEVGWNEKGKRRRLL